MTRQQPAGQCVNGSKIRTQAPAHWVRSNSASWRAEAPSKKSWRSVHNRLYFIYFWLVDWFCYNNLIGLWMSSVSKKRLRFCTVDPFDWFMDEFSYRAYGYDFVLKNKPPGWVPSQWKILVNRMTQAQSVFPKVVTKMSSGAQCVCSVCSPEVIIPVSNKSPNSPRRTGSYNR